MNFSKTILGHLVSKNSVRIRDKFLDTIQFYTGFTVPTFVRIMGHCCVTSPLVHTAQVTYSACNTSCALY